MKFTKTALAVAAIVGSVGAAAQTANVTLYGYINTSLESNRGSQGANTVGKTPTSLTINRMTSNSSRFGLRGREELGGGTYAFFQLENGFNSDDGGLPSQAATAAIPSGNGNAIIWGRELWVGIGGGFGEVKVGYGLTPYDDVLGLAHQNIGSTGLQNRNNGFSGGPGFATQQLFTPYGRGGVAFSESRGDFDARAANAISYASPSLGGLTIRTMYSLIQEQSTTPRARLWDTAVIYSNGPKIGRAHV